MTDAVTGADLVCVLTEWEEFRYADPHALGELVARQAGHRRPQLPRPATVDRGRLGLPRHGPPHPPPRLTPLPPPPTPPPTPPPPPPPPPPRS